jgi:hypothetical protein
VNRILTLLSAVLLGAASPAGAYEIEKMSYDPSIKTVYVSLVYEGGEKEHNFSSAFDECVKDTTPYQQAVRLIDSGWNDTGTTTLHQVVPVDLSTSDCLPAELTVFASQSHKTIYVE